MGRERLTIKEIARMSGVSTATVSRVLNQPERVSPKVRERVQKIIEAYDFVPNQLAKNFSSNVSNCIALFIYDITNPFFTRLTEELNSVAFDNNYSLIICDTRNSEERELQYLRFLQSIKVSGLIVTEGASEETVARISDSMLPMVLVDRSPGQKTRFPLITSDNRGGARKATEHLIQLGHTKIAFVSGPEKVRTSLERKLGYLDALKEHDLPLVDEYVFFGDFKVTGGIRALEYFLALQDPPTAIFCANDLMAQGVLLRAYSLNLSVPSDFSLIGFDGVLSETLYPRLTTVRQEIPALAGAAMRAMLQLINGDTPSEDTIVIPTRLLVGQTCRKI